VNDQRQRHGRVLALVVALVAMLRIQPLRAEELAAEQVAFFEQKIRPLLIAKCYKCHSAEVKAPKGGLRLDTRDGWVKGGDGGPAILPGRPQASRLITAVRYADSALQMPPAGKLKPHEIEDLVTWVRIGAPDPRAGEALAKLRRSIDFSAARQHWAFKPLGQIPRPDSTKRPVGPARPRAPDSRTIDAFIHQRLAKEDLAPPPPADRVTLLRRVTFDLSGLPPTPNEIAAFLQDESAEAYEKVVDRLLNATSFGEHFGRKWLDLMCYADTHDLVGIPALEAWRYRDYVIASLNSDKPFDRFVLQQLAGDLLPAANDAERRENLIATGFLMIGPHTLEDVDKPQLRMDVVDHQIQKIGRAFLGLSLGCARCHDHKFDPVPRDDYYALAGIFASTQTVRGILRSTFSDVVKVALPETPGERAAREAALKEHRAKLEAARLQREEADRAVVALKRLVAAALAAPPSEPVKASKTVAASAEDNAALAKALVFAEKVAAKKKAVYFHTVWRTPAPPMALGVEEAKTPADCRINIRGSAWVLGESVPRGFVRVATRGTPPSIPSNTSGRRQLADWLLGNASHLTARVTVNRLWSNVFGRGLVSTVDDFGKFGDRPSHPELLDYLADTFIESGWSVKAMVRSMVLSDTYRSASTRTQRGMARDPENRLLWRANPRRLRAEEIRDAMLAVSGKLNGWRGGPCLPIDNLDNVRNLGDVDPETLSLSRPLPHQARQRTVYLPVYRGSQYGLTAMLDVFNFAFPNEIVALRDTTIVAPQALFLMNSEFVRTHSAALSARLERESADDKGRVERLYLLAYGRRPEAHEADRALQFAKASGWPKLCRVVLASNDFLFVR
jgi:hypothetical protein